MQEGTLETTRNKAIGLCGLSFVGIILQIISVPAPASIELVCGVVYLIYNIVGMVLVRVMTIAMKFEDKAMLTYAFRMAAAMGAYCLSVILTLPFFEMTAALKLMSLSGLVNVIICVPASFREMFYINRARTSGVGNDGTPLGACDAAIVSGFWVLGTGLVVAMAIVALTILANGATGGSLWELLFVLYCVMNLVPFFLPKVTHLVTTETSTRWPKLMMVHFVCVLISVFCMAPAIPMIKKHSLQKAFGIVGVINGLIVQVAIACATAYAYYKPRKEPAPAGVEIKETAPFRPDC